MLKLSWGPNGLYALLCYFYDIVIRLRIALSCKISVYVEDSFSHYLFYRNFLISNIWGSQEEAKSCSGYCAWGLIAQAFEAHGWFDHSEVVCGCFFTVFQLSLFVYACLALFPRALRVLWGVGNLREGFVVDWARAQISPALA
jgi:hypothetical protein